MNVAFAIESLGTGGAERVVEQLAATLAQRGCGSFVYCLKAAGESGAVLRRQGVVLREAHSFGRDPLLAWRLGWWMAKDRIDVINAQSSAATVWTLPAAKLLGIPLLQTRQGVLLGPMLRYPRLADRLIRLIDRVGIVAETLRETLPAGRVAREAVYLPNCVDRAPVPRAEARGTLLALCGHALGGPVVLAVGTICAEKDTCGLLRAFALLRRDWPDARLVCAGPLRGAAYGAEVKRVERELGLEGCVDWLGAVPNAYRIIAAADVFCLPSRTEAMPVAVVEAMSQHVPIVATAVGGIGRLGADAEPGRYLIRHNETGLLVPPGRPAALAEALGMALSDPASSLARADRALEEYHRSFTAACMAQRYLDVFNELTRGRGRAGRRRRERPGKPGQPAVLMIGPGTEQTGGMASVVDALMASALRETCALHRFSTTSRTLSEQEHSDRGVVLRAAQRLLGVARHVGALHRLACVIRREGISIVHIHTCSSFSFYRSLLDLAVAKLLGCRVILHIHGGRFAEFCESSGRLGGWLIRRGSEAAQAVLVLSRGWRDRLQPYLGRARIEVVPNGVDTGVDLPLATPDPARPCRFLYLGALVESKGLRDLISAAGRLRDAGTPFELMLAGSASPAERAGWQQRVRALELQGMVTVHGPVRGEDKLRLLATVDCLVLPSHSEGLPLVILEAGAVGLPVIATAVGSIPELLRATPPQDEAEGSAPLAPLIAPHDPVALADEMTRMATDAGLRREIGTRLRAHIRANYSLERQAQRIAELYMRRPRWCRVRHVPRAATGNTTPGEPLGAGDAAVEETSSTLATSLVTHTQRGA